MRYDALDEVWAEVEKLSPGEHSGVFESTYGFHIVLRCREGRGYMAEHRDELYRYLFALEVLREVLRAVRHVDGDDDGLWREAGLQGSVDG